MSMKLKLMQFTSKFVVTLYDFFILLYIDLLTT